MLTILWRRKYLLCSNSKNLKALCVSVGLLRQKSSHHQSPPKNMRVPSSTCLPEHTFLSVDDVFLWQRASHKPSSHARAKGKLVLNTHDDLDFFLLEEETKDQLDENLRGQLLSIAAGRL